MGAFAPVGRGAEFSRCALSLRYPSRQVKPLGRSLHGGAGVLVENGKLKDRPQLKAVIATARKNKAKLMIAKLGLGGRICDQLFGHSRQRRL
jgi:hypothetical protein